MILYIYKASHWCYCHGFHRVSRLLTKVIFLLFNAFIPGSASIGAGTRLGYSGMGIVFHKNATVGRDCLVGHQVTLGTKVPYFSNIESFDVPCVGDNVYVGSGSKLLGKITIGHNSVIAANSVVITDVPENVIYAGSPPRFVREIAGNRAILFSDD